MPDWDAEIEVDEALARQLIRGSYPELDSEPLRMLGIGWDNTVWATGDGVAFRFPRREPAVAGLTREITFLPQLAPRLPCAIPDAAYPGSPSALFPWPWLGSSLIEGRELAEHGLEDGGRGPLAEDLGAFLGCLHALSIPDLDALPRDPMGRADMTIRVPRTRAALGELGPSRAVMDRAESVLIAAEALPATNRYVLAHGDLHVRHVLVDGAGRLAGVIDWGDLCCAAPAVDLSPHWSIFPPTARERFLTAYGDVDGATLLRARVLALFLNATLAVYARANRVAALEGEALSGLERTLTD